MRALTEAARSQAGCGYAPTVERIYPWAGLGYKGATPTVCPGYSTNLPEVIEVARARFHWTKGELSAFTHGRATDALMIGIEILEGAVNECQAWCTTPRDKGGGAT